MEIKMSFHLDKRARKLAEENIQLAYWVANKWFSKLQDTLSFEEMLSDCMYGLCKAAGRFDKSRGLKFTAYATRAMENQILINLHKTNKFQPLLFSTIEDFEDKNGKHDPS
ncbi:MAG: sigma factor [Bacillota bacterium]|nr:sigma factor [Bacillota bacterium]